MLLDDAREPPRQKRVTSYFLHAKRQAYGPHQYQRQLVLMTMLALHH